MRHTRFFISGICLLFLVFITLAACRKKNIQKPGVTVTTTIIDPSVSQYDKWTKVNSPYDEVQNLAIDDTSLVFSARINNYPKLVQMSPDFLFTPLVNSSLVTNQIHDLETYNGKIYYGGNIITSYGNHLFSYSIPDSWLHGFNISGQTSAYEVRDLQYFQGKLYFCGKFDPFSTFTTTNYTDRINLADETEGTGGLTNAPEGLFADDSQMFVYGKAITPQFNTPNIAKWTGSYWASYYYSGITQSTMTIKSLAVLNDTIYVAYVQDAAPDLTKPGMIVGNQFYPITNLTVTAGGFLQFKLADGELYAIGKGLKTNGVYTNVLKKEGMNWTFNKLMQKTVYDIIPYYQTLYIGTSDGIYHE